MSDIWVTGFHISALDMVTALSGLVDVVDVQYSPTTGVVLFAVRRKTPRLFSQGSLQGARLDEAELKKQPLLVDLSSLDHPFYVEECVSSLYKC